MKERKLVILLPQFTQAQRGKIAQTAARLGFTPLFADTAEEALRLAPDAEVFFGSAPEFTRAAKALRWVCAPSAGVNQYLADGALPDPETLLSNSSGAYGVTISEHIVMVSLEMMRRQQDYSAIVSQRKWVRDLPVTSLKDCRITLVGTGDIGQEAAVRLRAFSPAALIGVNRGGRNPKNLFDRIVMQTDLAAVLPETDLLIVSLPGTKDTFRMLDARMISLLPDGAIVVNVGRGSVIDQRALFRELSSGRLKAALDVFEEEPIPQDDPAWECPNLLITPHVAGNMTLPYTVQRIADLFLSDLERYARGLLPERLVNREKGY